jgi:hypothetical protein
MMFHVCEYRVERNPRFRRTDHRTTYNDVRSSSRDGLARCHHALLVSFRVTRKSNPRRHHERTSPEAGPQAGRLMP